MDHTHHHHGESDKDCCHGEKGPGLAPEAPVGFMAQMHGKITLYKPLAVIVGFCGILAAAPIWMGQGDLREGMYGFMGYFFVFLALFKFFDLKGFVEGFETYDLVTKAWRPYGYAYPFLELGLGLLYLNQFHLNWVNPLTFILMSISGVGVLKSVFSGQKIKCACLGTVINVPLGAISVLENLGMAAMAVYMMFAGI